MRPALLDLAAAMRAQGHADGVSETMDAVEALASLDLTDPEDVRLGLRTAFARSREAAETFDRLFPLFLAGRLARAPQAPPASGIPGAGEGEEAERIELTAGDGGDTSFQAVREAAGTTSAEGGRDLLVDSQRAMRQAAALWRQTLGRRPSRRLHPDRRASRLDVRRTLRVSVGSGEMWDLRWQGPRPDPLRIVLLIDGSRSMSRDAQRYLAFGRALFEVVGHTEVYLFSTELVRVTPALSARRQGRPTELTGLGHGFGGGTLIGEALTDFLERDGRRLLGRRTVVVVASDGLEAGAPGMLGRAARAVGERAGLFVWLNPLKVDRDYAPLARGMAAALPSVDVFAAGESAIALAALSSRLRFAR